LTKQRELVLKIVKDSGMHLSAEGVYLRACRTMPSIVKATVYNNLNYLTTNGLIRRVKIHGGPDLFDGTLSPHEHLVCDVCGKVSDLSLEDIKDRLERAAHVNLTGYELTLHYVCTECQARQHAGGLGGTAEAVHHEH